MTDVFISYSRKDRARAEVMAKTLKSRGLDVWWDTHLKAGAEFRQEIADKLESSKAVIVIWSEESVASRFVCDEADVGAAQDTLFPVLVDLVDIPLGFRQIQTADLTRWRGKASDRQFLSFVDIIEDVVGGRRTLGVQTTVVETQPEERIEPAMETAPVRAKKEKKPKRRKASRNLMITGQKARFTLIFRSLVLAALISGAFWLLATRTEFILPEYLNYLVGGLAVLVFVTRYLTFQADRKSGGASLRLMSRSYFALFFFALIATAPFMLEGRMYAAVMEAVRMAGIEGADINAVAFDASGNKIATSSDDHTVRVWDANTGVQLSSFVNHEEWVWGAAFSPDGDRVVSVSRDLTGRVWDAATGEELMQLTGHKSTLRAVVYDPKGRYIATGSSDRTIRFWDPETGEEVRRLEGHQDRITALAVSRDGTLIASASFDGTVKLWRALNGTLVRSFSGAGDLADVAFSPREARLAAVSEQGTGFVWDINGTRVARLGGHGKLFAVRFTDEGRLVTTAGLDGIIRLWNISNGTVLREFTGHEGGIRGLDISGDGRVLVSGSRDNTARVWDLASGKEVKIMGHITPAVRLPVAIDRPPLFVASRAPVPVNLSEDRHLAQDYALKGLGVGFVLLVVGVFLRILFNLIRQRNLSRWMVVGSLGVVTLYVAALMLSSFPAEATFLWLTAAFVPMTVLAIARWIMAVSTGGRL